ncbi:transcriptional regulator ATRX-like [Impatiens glandulifera]|uniref:transcriptional regulator ATRX-like n=1 Tax=Impatiens glandulifera TaxID=253017 RepID=UPI001FB0B449|nr:transcriptional regulator ATRX-like [Impatiens glandulifera]
MGGGTGTTMIDSGCRSSTRRYRTTRTGKLFFCFNSRFFSSSSSMNISSRSILSPARHHPHPHPLSLSASLSRRLRTDGSLKGGQSPMFPTNTASNSKKRTSGALDNPEPSSPKVTCIGQVRVKSKKKKNNNNKHGRKLRNPSRRRSGGDGSFRRTDNWGSIDLSSSSQSNILPENKHRNQRWVHLPLTICEGLKGLGAEISCLLPCRSSSCFSSERGSKRERSIRSNLEEIEISREKFEANKLDTSDVGEEEDEEKLSVCVPPKNALLLMRCRSDPMRMAALSRRLLESPLSNGDEPAEGNNNVHVDADFEETEPKRCSQASAYLITPVIGGVEGNENENLEADSVIDMPEEVEEHFDEDSSGMGEELDEESEQRKEEPPPLYEEENSQRGSTMEEEEDSQRSSTMEEEEEDIQRSSTMEEEEDTQRDSTMEEEEEDIQRDSTMEEEEEDIQRSSTMEEEEDTQRDSTMEEEEEDIQRDSTMEEEEEDIQRYSTMEEEEEGDSLRGSTMMNEEEDIQRGLTMEEEKEDILRGSTMKEEEENEIDAGPLSASGNEDEQKKFIEEEKKEEECESASSVRSSDDNLAMESTKEEKAAATNESEEAEVENEEEEEEDDDPAAAENKREMALPDCLLLMMCEPKVSMEVSKETWVCSNDFMQFLPERRRRPANKTLGGDVENKKVVDRSRKAAAAADELNLKQAQQPPRSSCSIPEKAAPVQKLPRCKSEPMRTSAAKLVPSSSETSSSCVWKIRKVEQPLRRGPTAVGLVGGSATGLGF